MPLTQQQKNEILLSLQGRHTIVNDLKKKLKDSDYFKPIVAMSGNIQSGQAWFSASIKYVQNIIKKSEANITAIKGSIDKLVNEDSQLKSFMSEKDNECSAAENKFVFWQQDASRQVKIFNEYTDKYRSIDNDMKFKEIIMCMSGLIDGNNQIKSGKLQLSVSKIFSDYLNQGDQAQASANEKGYVLDYFSLKFIISASKMLLSFLSGSFPKSYEKKSKSEDKTTLFTSSNVSRVSVSPVEISLSGSNKVATISIFPTNAGKTNFESVLQSDIADLKREGMTIRREHVLFKEFFSFIYEMNSANKKDEFLSFVNSLPGVHFKVIGSGQNYNIYAEIDFSRFEGNEVGEVLRIETLGNSSLKVQAYTSNSFIYKKNIVERIISNAIGESPLYKCRHNGDTYYYTPAQLVVNDGYIKDKDGKKFKPKNGKPASLYGRSK